MSIHKICLYRHTENTIILGYCRLNFNNKNWTSERVFKFLLAHVLTIINSFLKKEKCHMGRGLVINRLIHV